MQPTDTPSAANSPDERATADSAAHLLVAALLQDRRAERHRSYFKWSVLGVMVLGVALACTATSSSDTDEQPRAGAAPYASLVRVEGTIEPGSAASAEALIPQLERAFSDKASKGVVLLVNSPGGTPVQSSLVHDRILELRAANPGKKVVAVGEDMVTSGAYMIASAADSIVVNRSTVTGSIGVITRGFGFSGLMQKLGVERRVQTAGESKNMADPFMPQSEVDRSRQAHLLKSIHVHFIDTVTQARGERLKLDTPGLFSGMVWTGEEAVQAGLADALGDMTSVKVSLGVTQLRDLTPSPPLLRSLLGDIRAEVSAQLRSDSVASGVPMALPR